MSCDSYTTLNRVEYISKELESQNITHGVIDFFDWATLGVGNYQNITINPPTSGVYGGQKHALRSTTDPRFTDNSVWEGFKGNWVWETGVSFTPPPIRVSGVYVDGDFHPPDSSTYPHYIDYRRGRAVFISGVPASTSTVTAEFSPRVIQFVDGDNKYAKQLMYESYRVDDTQYLNADSGNWNRLSDLRAELPMVSVSVSPTTTYHSYQIGGGQRGDVDIYFHVYAESKFWRDQICDMIGRQNDKAFWLLNRGTMKTSTDYPFDLDYRGALVASPTEYPQLISPTGDGGYQWRQIYFKQTSKQFIEFRDDFLFEGVVKTTAEVYL